MAAFFSIFSLWYLLAREPQLDLHDWQSSVPHRIHLSHAVAWRKTRGASFPRCVFAMHSSMSLGHFMVSWYVVLGLKLYPREPLEMFLLQWRYSVIQHFAVCALGLKPAMRILAGNLVVNVWSLTVISLMSSLCLSLAVNQMHLEYTVMFSWCFMSCLV